MNDREILSSPSPFSKSTPTGDKSPRIPPSSPPTLPPPTPSRPRRLGSTSRLGIRVPLRHRLLRRANALRRTALRRSNLAWLTRRDRQTVV
ncbi:hypothetical protein M8818_005471 [Zalaria obscura]|uniref:Uncharacterized protein n=1 Tax=Zalaria obscura TaxID=2024903 RepID=A0ACC3S919_9PEZI